MVNQVNFYERCIRESPSAGFGFVDFIVKLHNELIADGWVPDYAAHAAWDHPDGIRVEHQGGHRLLMTKADSIESVEFRADGSDVVADALKKIARYAKKMRRKK